MSKKFTTPKRRIERIRNRIDALIGTGIGVINLHAAEDAKTLVRTIINLSVVHIGGTDGETDYSVMIMRSEKSIPVINPGTTQVTDSPAPIALIWEDANVLHLVDATGPSPRRDIFADIKGMRKLKEEDVIELAHIASASTVLRLIGTVTLFFKE